MVLRSITCSQLSGREKGIIIVLTRTCKYTQAAATYYTSSGDNHAIIHEHLMVYRDIDTYLKNKRVMTVTTKPSIDIVTPM